MREKEGIKNQIKVRHFHPNQRPVNVLAWFLLTADMHTDAECNCGRALLSFVGDEVANEDRQQDARKSHDHSEALVSSVRRGGRLVDGGRRKIPGFLSVRRPPTLRQSPNASPWLSRPQNDPDELTHGCIRDRDPDGTNGRRAENAGRQFGAVL